MAIALHFDTLNYVEKAETLGIPNEVAKFQARQIEQAIEVAVSTVESKKLATKNDNSELQKDLVAAELRLVKWILGTGIAGVLAIAGLLKFMH